MAGRQAQRPQVVEPTSNSATPACEACGGVTVAKEVDITMWTAKGLILIEHVDSFVCEDCEAQYYDELASQRIQALIVQGFPKEQKTGEITVPVYSLKGILAGTLPDEVM